LETCTPSASSRSPLASLELAMCRLSAVAAPLLLLVLALAAQAEGKTPVNTTNVCVDPSSGSAKADGDYFDKCLSGAAFGKDKKAYSFNSAFIEKTTFTGTQFVDGKGPKDVVDFKYAFWTDVVFSGCLFESKSINFSQAIFGNVKFIDCVFKNRAVFDQITIENTQFSKCTFEDGAVFSQADLTNATFTSNVFKGTETVFRSVTVRTTKFIDNSFDALRFLSSGASDLAITGGKIKEFNCHEPLKEGQYVVNRAEFNTTTISKVEIERSACDQTIWRDSVFSGVSYGGSSRIDMSSSNFSNVKLEGVTNRKGDCADLDIRDSNFNNGGSIVSFSPCKADFSNTTFGKMDVKGLELSKYPVKGSVFGSLRINGNECCSQVCGNLGCKCDIPKVATDGCPPGTSKVNINIDPNSERKCFPGSATVQLASGAIKRMDALDIGDSVLVGPGVFSPVFMFTHRLPTLVVPDFVKLTTASGAALTVTPGHLIYADNELVAAGSVRVGAALRLADGSTSVVARAERSVADIGLFNPQTVHGDVVVDGVVASCYTRAVAAGVAHALLAPARAVFGAVGFGVSVDNGADALRSLL
jgi:uncharacterized protein YjbI with pentapeptide repeats